MSGRVTTQLVIDGKNNSQKAFQQVDKSLNELDRKSLDVGKNLKQLFTVAAVTQAVRSYLDVAGAAGELDSRIKLTTKSQEEFNEVQGRLQELSRRTYKSFAETAEVYISAAKPLKELGFTTEDTLGVVEAMNLGLVASAATGDKAARVIQQFGRGLQQGVIRGDSFNAVLEDAPVLLDALATGLGVSRAEILRMAQAGELTTERVIPALTSQIDSLKAKVEEMPTTFRDANVVLGDAFTQAIKEFDNLSGAGGTATKSVMDFAEAIRAATKSEGFKAFAEFVGDGVSNFVSIGKDLGYITASLTGNVAELDRVDKEIEKIEAALNGFGMLDLIYTDAQLQVKLKQFQDYREQLLEQMAGLSKDARDKMEEGQKAEAEALAEYNRLKLAGEQKWVRDMSSMRSKLLEDTKASIKAQVAEEKKAVGDIAKIRDQRLAIEKKYSDTLAAFAGAGRGGATFGTAQDLMASARQALVRGDFENAKQQAEAARQILVDLANAGENTYGFQGFANQLKQIELAANDLEQSKAEEKLKAIRDGIQGLKDQSKDLEQVRVTPKLDDAAVAALGEQIKALATSIGQQLTIPVQLDFTQPYTLQDAGPPPTGFATGGHVQGPGTGTSDSILARLSNGEYVMRAAAVKQYGTTLLDRMNGLHLPAFADGGMVEAAMSAPSAPSFPNLGRMVLEGGGQQVPIYVAPEQGPNLQRLAAKFGRTKRP
ncbi:tape measure protein [Pseudomonas argentinensis]|uniref:Tape measure domain-containing protein n=1 Tax=Phytopseudomonas argentinensis TaxID=289370 RepID=A0A1I3NT32_9GAMM|nr:tape measure protein [Pseudomonas argentinensis]KAB0549814.1 tape measure protein [Pseudomonas argentinensis]SFJ12140.1 tape measure domain-containing protein [Pseudomonas argentinensis]